MDSIERAIVDADYRDGLAYRVWATDEPAVVGRAGYCSVLPSAEVRRRGQIQTRCRCDRKARKAMRRLLRAAGPDASALVSHEPFEKGIPWKVVWRGFEPVRWSTSRHVPDRKRLKREVDPSIDAAEDLRAGRCVTFVELLATRGMRRST